MANKLQDGKSENLTNRGRGRPAGSVNKATKAFRDTVNDLLQANSENVALWLSQVANGVGGKEPAPEKALDLLAKLAEYAAPKLARTEIAGDQEKPLKTIIQWSE